MYDGKFLKKIKIGIKLEEVNLEFDEIFVFDVLQSELVNVYVVISVICLLKIEKFEYKLLGRIYIGLLFGG